MFRIRAILPVVACAGFVAACAALATAQDPVDAAHATAGQQVFQQNCSFCHGPTGRGASGPDLLRSNLVSHDENGNLIGPVIHNGRPDKGMPAFNLSDADISNISEFLHAETKRIRSAYHTSVDEYPVKKLLVGDEGKGKQYFAAHCATCHSETGNLAHVATKYSPFDLQSRIVFPSGAKPRITATDKSGNAFTGDQTYADEFWVSLRDSTGAIRTFSRTNAKIKIDDPLAEHEKLMHSYTDADIHNLFAYLETFK